MGKWVNSSAEFRACTRYGLKSLTKKTHTGAERKAENVKIREAKKKKKKEEMLLLPLDFIIFAMGAGCTVRLGELALP